MLKMPIVDGFEMHCISEDAGTDPIKRILPFLRFKKQALHILNEVKPSIIHVQGVDMLSIACQYKHDYEPGIHIIYEIADLHRLLVDRQRTIVNRISQIYLRALDRKLCKRIDLMILTSDKYYDSYFKQIISRDKVLVFPNVPDLAPFNTYKSKDHNKTFTIGFIGDIRYPEQIHNLLNAARQNGINLLIAGIDQCGSGIEETCKAYEKCEWYGPFNYNTEVAFLYSKCDVIYSVYNADMSNVRVALPNKLYESVYCGLPIIVAKNTYLSEIVEEWNVGISVDHTSVVELSDALYALRNNKGLYGYFEHNCEFHKKDMDISFYNDELEIILQKWLYGRQDVTNSGTLA